MNVVIFPIKFILKVTITSLKKFYAKMLGNNGDHSSKNFISGKMAENELGGNVTVGKWTLVGPGSRVYSWLENERVFIGRFCSIARDVKIFSGGEHGHTEHVANYHFRTIMLNSKINSESLSRGPVVIGNDVWIGSGAIIISGVSIGDGAVIGAGSVVTKNIPPYAIVVGNPARLSGFRFSEEIIRKLLDIKWWEWNEEIILSRIDDFYIDVEAFVDKYFLV